ncbi:hypothetical protein D3C84_1114890 [compost metagenome]
MSSSLLHMPDSMPYCVPSGMPGSMRYRMPSSMPFCRRRRRMEAVRLESQRRLPGWTGLQGYRFQASMEK